MMQGVDELRRALREVELACGQVLRVIDTWLGTAAQAADAAAVDPRVASCTDGHGRQDDPLAALDSP